MKKASYSIEGRCPELLAALDRFNAEDKQAERVKSVTCAIAAVAFVVAFVGYLSRVDGVIPFGVLVAAAAMGYYFYASRHDLDDARLAVPRQLVEVLQTDVPPKGKLSLKVDFRDYRNSAFLKNQGEGGVWTSTRSWDYAMPWFNARGRLADASQFSVSVVRNVKRKEKAKRKYTKVKEKMTDLVTLSLKVDPRRYPDLQALSPYLSSPPLGLTIRNVQAEGNQVTARLSTSVNTRVKGRHGTNGSLDDLASGDHLLAGLVWLYRGIKGLKSQSM